MCIKCLLLALVTAENEKRSRAAEPAATEAVTPISLEQQADGLEIERMLAEIRNIDADTILKLSNAAGALYKANIDTSGVIRTMDRLLVPTQAAYATEPAGPTAAEPAPETPASDELPPELVAHIAELKAAGYDVDVLRIEL